MTRKFTFFQEVLYTQYVEVEAESEEQAREILNNCIDPGKYIQYESDNLYGELILKAED